MNDIVVSTNYSSKMNQSINIMDKITTFKVRNPMLSYFAPTNGIDGSYRPHVYDLYEYGRIMDVESFVCRAFLKKRTLMFKEGYDLSSDNESNAKYIKKRLAEIAYVSGQTFDALIRETSHNLVVFHNAYMVKVRKLNSSSGVVRTVNKTPVQPVAAYFNLPPESVEVRVDSSGTPVMYRQKVQTGKYVEYPASAILHLHYNKRTGFVMGTPPLEPVKDDILALRRIEESIETLIYKSLFPIIHVKVGNEKQPAKKFMDGTSEVEIATSYLDKMEDDGGIVTSERVEIKAIGAESLALRVESYLNHFKERVFIGLGMSGIDFGVGDCYSDDTEVLTESGWKLHSDINHSIEKIATYNQSTNLIEFDLPTGKYEGTYNGEMIAIKNKHTDILVTPNHDLFIKKREYHGNTTLWNKVKANDVYNNCGEFKIIENAKFANIVENCDIVNITTDKKHKGAPVKSVKCSVNDFASLLGWFISEGSLNKSSAKTGHYRFSISQNEGSKLTEIIRVVKACGLTYALSKDKRDTNVNVVVYGKAIYKHLEQYIGHGAWHKNLPRYVFEWPEQARLNLLNALIDGDGTRPIDRANSVTYFTVSKKLADDVQQLAMSLGMYAKVKLTIQSENAYGTYIYTIHMAKTYNDILVRTITKDTMSKVQYTGTIFCYTVPNGLFLTRRNGKTTIQGNSTGRATGEVLSESLKESVIDYQYTVEEFITEKIFNELLCESGRYQYEYMINDDNKVYFQFNDLDVPGMIKKESHQLNKMTQGAQGINEARKAMGHKPKSPEELKQMAKELQYDPNAEQADKTTRHGINTSAKTAENAQKASAETAKAGHKAAQTVTTKVSKSKSKTGSSNLTKSITKPANQHSNSVQNILNIIDGDNSFKYGRIYNIINDEIQSLDESIDINTEICDKYIADCITTIVKYRNSYNGNNVVDFISTQILSLTHQIFGAINGQ